MTRKNVRSEAKPNKPRPDFPLTAHNCGKWVKKIGGKCYYFGEWSNPDEALKEYFAVKRELQRGPVTLQACTVKYLCNAYLTHQAGRLGEIDRSTFKCYHAACKVLIDNIDGNRLVASLKPEDFLALRQSFAGYSLTYTRQLVKIIRRVFCFGADNALHPTIKLGTFDAPSMRAIRRQQAGKKRTLTAAECHELLESLPAAYLAMGLLSLNCAYGPTDLSRLRHEHIDGRWINFPRPKTGQLRRAWLWESTREALPDNVGHVFQSRWLSKTLCNFIRPWGVTWYALRHTFATVASQAGDEGATRAVMGHADGSMLSAYVHATQDVRIKRVCEFVETWLRR